MPTAASQIKTVAAIPGKTGEIARTEVRGLAVSANVPGHEQEPGRPEDDPGEGVRPPAVPALGSSARLPAQDDRRGARDLGGVERTEQPSGADHRPHGREHQRDAPDVPA